jgi:ketosteroid isomerase-like protein
MSQENVEIVRRGYEALNRGGIDGAVGLLAPGVRWDALQEPSRFQPQHDLSLA